MKLRKVFLASFLFLMISFGFAVAIAPPGNSLNGDLSETPEQGLLLVVDINDRTCSDETGNPYCTIQSAVDDLVVGGKVVVKEGVYVENVAIDKPLTLEAEIILNEVPEGFIPKLSVIDGSVEILSDDVIIKHFGIMNAECGINAFGVDSVEIFNNEIYSAEIAVCLTEVSSSLVRKNNIHDNNKGIVVEESQNIEILENHVFGNTENGVSLYSSVEIDVEDNVLGENTVYGIFVFSGSFVQDTLIGHNEIFGSSGEDSSGVYVENDLIELRGNDIHGNTYGVYLVNSNLEFEENNVHENSIGLFVDEESWGVFALNNFMDNEEAGLESVNEIDARFNYWGSLFGPTTSEFEAGDVILTEDSSYSPWLAADFTTAIEDDSHVGFEKMIGGSWDVISTPVSLEESDLAQLVPAINEVESIALNYNSDTRLWEIASNQETLRSTYIFIDETSMRLPVNPELTAPSTMDVHEGWNLWGPSHGGEKLKDFILGEDTFIQPEEAFVYLFEGGFATFSQWISPQVGDQNSGVCTVVDPSAGNFVYECDNEAAADLYSGQGYWVFLNQNDVIGGSSSTPVSLEWLRS